MSWGSPRAGAEQSRSLWSARQSWYLSVFWHPRSLSVSIQELFGRNGFEKMMFQLFDSSAKDLLFSDDTECLSNLQNKTTYETYLGPQYLTLMGNFRQCLSSGKYNGPRGRNSTRFKVSMFISRTQSFQVLNWHGQGRGEVETFSWPCRRIQLPLSRFS